MTQLTPRPAVETYRVAGRRATKVTLPDGRVVKFFDLLPARDAVRQAAENVARNPESYPLPATKE